MRSIVQPIRRRFVALRALALLAWATRFRMRGAYWSWRRETAFGGDPNRRPSRGEEREAMIEYGAWVGAMRALRGRRGLFR